MESARPAKPLIRTSAERLLPAVVVGSTYGLVRALAELRPLDGLPPAQLVNLVLLDGAAWCAVAVLAAGVLLPLRLGRGARPAWTGWLALAGVLAVELGAGSAGLLGAGAGLLAAALCAALARRLPWLESGALWGCAGGAAGLAAVLRLAPSSGSAGPTLALLAVLPLVPLLALLRSTWPLRRTVFCSVGAVSVAALVAGALRTPTHAGGTSVLLATIDTLRADAVGCYGGERASTPTLDGLAAAGLLFEDVRSPVPMTYPAHTSLLSGTDPGTHRVLNNMPWRIAAGVETLPELLARKGYATAAFVSGFTLKRDVSRLHERFQVYDDTFSPLRVVPDPLLDTPPFALLRGAGGLVGLKLRRLRYGGDRPAERCVDSALEWLEAVEEPFFLWVHLFDPHVPYEPPPELARLHDPDYGGDLDGYWYRVPLDRKSRVVRDPREYEHLRALYRGEVSHADAELGRLLAGMDAAGRAADTLVIATSDHGESLGEHDYWFDHSYFLYETCLRVPLLVRPPAAMGERWLAPGSRVGAPVRLIDLAPTLAELLDAGELARVDGRSLVPLLAGSAADAPPPAFAATYDLRPDKPRYLLAVRDGRFKYVRTDESWDDLWRIPGREELFDLMADPGELDDLAERAPAALERMRALAGEAWSEWRAGAEAAVQLSDEDRARLGDIGY